MSARMTKKTLGRSAAASAIALTLVAVPTAAQAKPDTGCMQAGIAALKDAGLLSTVAESGVPLSAALDLGVLPRPTTDVASLPSVLPFSVVLADHRAGDSSLFVYPWCS
jgi:hypothetical protein